MVEDRQRCPSRTSTPSIGASWPSSSAEVESFSKAHEGHGADSHASVLIMCIGPLVACLQVAYGGARHREDEPAQFNLFERISELAKIT